MNKSVLIAGGAGFIGSYLCDYYVKEGYQTYCIDNLSTSTGENISQLENNKNFHFIKHDIVLSLPEEISKVKYNIVINLASPASPPRYQKLSIETLLVGSQGTLNLLELAKLSNARFFQASTSEVYGDPDIHPQPENYWGKVHCYGPRSMYDEAKRYGEALIYAYRERYGLDTVIARFFNTYGPRMDPEDGRVVTNLIGQALNEQPMTIYGKGDQTRSFCYIEDLIEGIVRLINSDLEGPVNLGNPHEFTILELATKIRLKTGTSSKFINKPLPGDDPTQRQPDISSAKEKLDWQPKIELDEGLEKTISYFKTSMLKA